VPAFVVFSDKTLRVLASARPGDERALAAVPGIGPAKLERYGSELLALLAAPA
jgi:DNA helicase-2/ATP-dependent DNA helicase PcrA